MMSHSQLDRKGRTMKNWLTALALVTALSGAPIEARAQSTPSTSQSTWPMSNFDYGNTRAATGTAISSANVGQLAVDGMFDVDGVSDYSALATTPVVVNGVVYLQDLQSNVYAI
jgi:alcohol dehydrogenase (cytochrome c)